MAPAPKAPDESIYSGRVAARLRLLREKAGLTVEEVCERMDAAGYPLALQSFYSWENGRRQPNWDALPAMSVALGVSIRTLIPIK